MKNFIKKFSVYLTIVMCLVSMVVMAVPGFAAEDDVLSWASVEQVQSPIYLSASGNECDDGSYDGVVYICTYFFEDENELLLPGSYFVSGAVGDVGDFPLGFFEVEFLLVDIDSEIAFYCNFGDVFTVPEGYLGGVMVQSYNVEPVLYRVVDDSQPEGLYYSAYELLQEAFYGADVELTDAQDMTLTMMATLAALFVIVVPFIVVWFVITMLGRWR